MRRSIGAGVLAHPEHLIDLRPGQRPIRGGDSAQYFGVQLNFLERDLVMEPEVDVVSHASPPGAS